MFEHFTFSAQSRFPCQEEDPASPFDNSSSISPPPSSLPFQCEPSQPGMGDIVHQMSKSSLSPESEVPQRSVCRTTTDEPIMDVDDEDEDPFSQELSYTAPPIPLSPRSADGTVACRRVQRQRITQKQSCSNHVRDITALVEEMIEGHSQCTFRKTPTTYLQSPPPSRGNDEELVVDPTIPVTYFNRYISPDEDDAFDDMEDYGLRLIKEEISLRRQCVSSASPSGVRKHTGGGKMSHRRSGELLNGTTAVVDGRLKVRSAPRMRKRRRLQTVHEQGS
ncbi:hypothetical protein BJ875DRAFT_384939 [Amylocarpus encephaloides]|uniref:Uncharacterized protein n=1 Tax=Amylocarpus encephaloides TaxID=45428 RepID=A0A9P7YC08_9HELO|nr:hypothetical protein BJ875DRAFT_384939 [Amylocarpus encephaloides]